MTPGTDPFHEEDMLILFDDKRQREHRRQQSVFAVVDDTDDAILHHNNRGGVTTTGAASMVYDDGDEDASSQQQRPKFWKQLKSAWQNGHHSGNQYGLPPNNPSPTSVRDVTLELLHAQQPREQAHCTTSSKTPGTIRNQDTTLDGLDGLSFLTEEDASRSTATTRRTTSMASTSSSTIDSSSQQHRPKVSMWDRLEAWSLQERRRVQDFHETVKLKNETTKAAAVGQETGPAESNHPASTTKKTNTAAGVVVAAPSLRARLRRQNSWNGRDSNRELLQARGSIMAAVDDCSLRHLLRVLDGDSDLQLDGDDDNVDDQDKTTNNRAAAASNHHPNGTINRSSHEINNRRTMAQNRADQCVMNLVM